MNEHAPQDPAKIAAAYFQAWKEQDWPTLRSVLADDVTFRGPLASLDDADACVEGLQGMSRIMTDVVVHANRVAAARLETTILL